MKKITVLIPCHNEEKGILKVLQEIPYDTLQEFGYQASVLVIDNNSTDNTARVAKENNAKVVFEPNIGKGNAIKTGFKNVSQDTDYIVMLDGDNTYKPKEIPRLLEPLNSGFCDVIVGSRLGGKVNNGALKLSNRIVNWGYAFLVRQFYGANITDVLSGFFAWKRDVVFEINNHLDSNGFTLEMELITKTVKLGYEIYSVPITYDEREGVSKINSIKDGVQILHVFFKNLFWYGEKKDMYIDVNTTKPSREIDGINLQ